METENWQCDWTTTSEASVLGMFVGGEFCSQLFDLQIFLLQRSLQLSHLSLQIHLFAASTLPNRILSVIAAVTQQTLFHYKWHHYL